MRVRNITTCALGLAAALTLGASELAAQQTQDTTRLRTTSETRINVSKGEVVTPARVDTVYITRIDTIRVDNTIVRVDTVTVMPPAPVVIPEVDGPMYWGLYGGTTWPWGNIDRLYTNGFHAGGVLGWESQRSLIGLRFDGAMSQINRENGVNPNLAGSGTPLMLHLAADLKVKPLNFGGWALYGIGGLNYNRYKRIALASTAGNECDFTHNGACYSTADDDRWSDKFGFNFGAGLDFHIGSQDMFLEARYMAIPANGARSWVLPISLGVRYF
jgi:opacity protein-like surface antigen